MLQVSRFRSTRAPVNFLLARRLCVCLCLSGGGGLKQDGEVLGEFTVMAGESEVADTQHRRMSTQWLVPVFFSSSWKKGAVYRYKISVQQRIHVKLRLAYWRSELNEVPAARRMKGLRCVSTVTTYHPYGESAYTFRS